MRIETRVPMDTEPEMFDPALIAAADGTGWQLRRKSGMLVDFEATLIPAENCIAISTAVYKV